MKITKKLPQFETAVGLFIVSGLQKVVFYRAHRGVIDELGRLEIPVPRYDRQGQFESRGKGRVISSGSVVKDIDDIVRQKLLQSLERWVERAARQYRPDEVYLFCPAYLIKEVRRHLRKHRLPLTMSIPGNYHEAHPFALLTMIGKRRPGRTVSLSDRQARRLLKQWRKT